MIIRAGGIDATPADLANSHPASAKYLDEIGSALPIFAAEKGSSSGDNGSAFAFQPSSTPGTTQGIRAYHPAHRPWLVSGQTIPASDVWRETDAD